MKITQTASNPSNLARYLVTLLIVLTALGWPSPAAAQGNFVRVNQTGYVSSAPKRAYLMTSASSAGASPTS